MKNAPPKHTSRKAPARTPRKKNPPQKNPGVPEHFYKKWVPDLRPVRTRACDHPDCPGVGEYRAPRNRELDDAHPLFVHGATHQSNYYWFCFDHVKIYNESWDYYEGFSALEMEAAIRQDGVWNRPTWPLGVKTGNGKAKTLEEELRDAVARAFMNEDGAGFTPPPHDSHAKPAHSFVHRKAEIDALRELDLSPPVDFGMVKKRYRILVKQHHPDIDHSHDAEEKIKRLNSVFTYLKNLYGTETA